MQILTHVMLRHLDISPFENSIDLDQRIFTVFHTASEYMAIDEIMELKWHHGIEMAS